MWSGGHDGERARARERERETERQRVGEELTYLSAYTCQHSVCVCVRACVRACVRVCARGFTRVFARMGLMSLFQHMLLTAC